MPYGSAGAEFVEEVARIIQCFADGSDLRCVAWRAVAVACHLLLQKPHDSKMMSNSGEHLSRRLALWKTGLVKELVAECICIQRHLPSLASAGRGKSTSASTTPISSDSKSDALFSRLVFSGRLHSAMRYLAPGASGGVLTLQDPIVGSPGTTVHDVLLGKHPEPSTPPDEVLLPGEPDDADPILFQRITPELIRKTGRQMQGSSGPSGLDSEAWCRMITGFKTASNRLCSALAASARCLCTEDVNGDSLIGFTSARLIPLDKNPGVRPIAVGEVYRRLICRAIAVVVERDVLSVTASLQTCVGVPSACESAVHAMSALFNTPEVEGLLFVDASNAFNALNRQAALHNVPRLCPALAKVFVNTYQEPIRLFVTGGGEILSHEGTCQGDPLAMAIYAVAVSPLVGRLAESCPTVSQSWYADDASAADGLIPLREYWSKVEALGPGYGYYPNASKTVLLTKPDHLDSARHMFGGTSIVVTASGSRYLGGAIGTDDFCADYMAKKSVRWVEELQALAKMAHTQPHAAYTVFSKGMLGRWQYHLRAMAASPSCLQILDDTLDQQLIPALLGHEPGGRSPERQLLSLPVRYGGLAIPIVAWSAPHQHAASKAITLPLVKLLVPGVTLPAPGVVPDIPVPSIASDTPAPSIASSPDVAAAASGTMDAVDLSGSATPVSFLLQDAETTLSRPRPLVLSSPRDADTTLSQPQPATTFDSVMEAISSVKSLARKQRKSCVVEALRLKDHLQPSLSPHQRLLTETAGEKGVSSWLTAIPSSSQPITILNKSDFRDGLCLRYGYSLDGLPATCVCGKEMDTDHALTCSTGGYPIARHNEIRNIVAEVLREVVTDVEVEPCLIPCDGEDIPFRTANRSAEARLDIRARGFWTRQQDAFFDVRVTHPRAVLLSRSEVMSQLKSHERMKKWEYGARVNQVERGSFTPLVFSTFGMCGPEANVFFKSLVSQVSEKNPNLSYSVVMGHLRCLLCFSLLGWAITCFRGCRGTYLRNKAKDFISTCHRLSRDN